MIIGIDIDDTIADTTLYTDTLAKEYTEQILKRKFEIHKTKSLDPMWCKHVYKWSIQEDKKFWDLYYEKLMKNVKPKQDAIKVINELYKENKIIIISSRWEKETGATSKITKEWFEKYNISFHSLYIGHLDKRKIVAENKIEIFIDDSAKICTELNSIGVKTLLMTTRLNQNVDVENIIRVNNWREIYKKIIAVQ